MRALSWSSSRDESEEDDEDEAMDAHSQSMEDMSGIELRCGEHDG